jgi:hypothetical protein
VPIEQFRQVKTEVAPTVAEYVPAEHFRHVEAPTATEYVPTEQLMHTDAELAPTAVEYLPS